MKKIFVFSVIILGLAGCGTGTPETIVAAAETGPTTACTTDADCYCRSFNGAEFVEGETTLSSCCTEVNGSRCPQVNYCQQCTYR